MSEHAVTLPHPDRQEATAGSCTCGWAIVYDWGNHEWARAAAEKHIRTDAHAEPYVLDTAEGTRYVRQGRSL